MERYDDSPDRVAGWGHNYFCGQCYRRIDFDPDRPSVHRCAHCGRVNEGEAYDEAWNYLYRDEVHVCVFYAAVLYRLHGDQHYLEWIRRVLRFYAGNYERFRVRVPEGYVGKIAGIDLCDAVAMVWLLQGMLLVKEVWSEEELLEWKRDLFLPEAELLYSHSRSIHNIPCWMMCAVGMIGLFFDEGELIDKALHSEYGLANQLKRGVTEEGFWFEGSVHYHFYCAEPFVYLLHFGRTFGVDLPDVQETVKRMFTYPVGLAFRNGRFPNPNDGWPLVSFSAYAGLYEWMNALFPDPSYEHALSFGYGEHYRPSFAFGGMSDSRADGWVQRLLFGRPSYRRLEQAGAHSRCDRDIPFCMLRNDRVEAFVKYGFLQDSHSHPDIMNIELAFMGDIVSYDISNSGYGSALFREWQRKSVAHNTVVVDGKDHETRGKGAVERFDGASCRFRAADVYPGVDYIRELQLDGFELRDTFEVSSGEERVIDWVFHCAGRFEPGFTTAPSPSPGAEEGYQHLLNVRRCDTDEAWEARWRLPDKTLTLRMAGSPGTEIYVFDGYEFTAERQRPGVLVRRRSRGAVFRAAFTFRAEAGDGEGDE